MISKAMQDAIREASKKVTEALTELAFPAREATMAAVKAAKDKPLRPTGSRFSNTG